MTQTIMTVYIVSSYVYMGIILMLGTDYITLSEKYPKWARSYYTLMIAETIWFALAPLTAPISMAIGMMGK